MSQLLSEKVTPSLYPDLPPDEHLDLLLPKLTIRYWIGMGGCVIVVALLISWTLRDGSGSKQAKGTQPCVACSWFTHRLVSLCTYGTSYDSPANSSDDGILECYGQGRYIWLKPWCEISQSFDTAAHKTL